MTAAGYGHLFPTGLDTVSPELPEDLDVMDPMVHLVVSDAVSGESSRHQIGSVSMMRELRLGLGDQGVVSDGRVDALFEQIGSATAGQFFELSPQELRLIESTISDFAQSLRRDEHVALALVDASPTVDRVGLLRGWSHRLTGRLLARHRAVTVGVTDSGLGIWFADHRRDAIHDIRAFQLGVEGAVVTDGAGTVHIVDGEATVALSAVASESTRWRVRRVPEVVVWATVLAGIESAVASADADHVGATVVVG